MIVKVFRAGEWQEHEIDEDQIITFQDGLVGCGAWRRFALWDEIGDSTVWTLLCIDEPGISLLATDPRYIMPEYKVSITDYELSEIGASNLDELVTLCVLVVRQDPPSVTANLVGPLIINTRTRQGKQMVLGDGEYSLRHPVVLSGSAKGTASSGLARTA